MTSPFPFNNFTAVAMPLLRANVDTDAIIPSREIKSVSKRGLAPALFAGWRYLDTDARTPNPNFVMNDDAYKDAKILLAGANFGCGSSREHAVWALYEYGIRAIFAPSFAPIFKSNCVRNGVLPGLLGEPIIARLAALIATAPQTLLLSVDLQHQQLALGPAAVEIRIDFRIDSDSRASLIGAADAIDVTFAVRADIEGYLARDRLRRPWVYLKSDP